MIQNKLRELIETFDNKYKKLDFIDNDWYQSQIGVTSFIKKAPKLDSSGSFSEEYIRARFVYALIYSGMYSKENMGIELSLPKGNGGKSINPDIVVFKTDNWQDLYEEAKKTKNYRKIRENMLVVFETKKNNESVSQAIENQLRATMEQNTSKDRIYGVYFDHEPDILIFKKIENSELQRYYEEEATSFEGEDGWNITSRDSLLRLPSEKEFITENTKISDLEKLDIDDLDPIDENLFSELINKLKRAGDRIKTESPLESLVVEFLTLKIYDEKRNMNNEKEYLDFYILPEEANNEANKLHDFRHRIDKLYSEAEFQYKNVIGGDKRIFKYDKKLRPNRGADEQFLIALIEIFQRRAILKTKNESFNQIIFNNFGDSNQKADKNQFFTPIPIVKNIIKMINPQQHETFCDPCCGICDFLAMGFKYTHDPFKLPDTPANRYYGFDLESSNLKLAELNLVLNGDGGANLFHTDSLTQKLMKNGATTTVNDFNTDNYDEFWNHKTDRSKDLMKYDVITTNPPFGKNRDLKTGKNNQWDLPKKTVELYETYHTKLNKSLPKSMDMGVLFLENAYRLLNEGGRMAIIISNSIASIPEWANVRTWLLGKMRIVASFDLPSNTFSETGVATTVLIAYKPREDEQFILDQDYDIYMKSINNLGYEVKTVNRSLVLKPLHIYDVETLENTGELLEDFTEMIDEFNEFMQRQEKYLKQAFYVE